LDRFTKRHGKFAIKGFTYKLGLLLHGPPGTGKTSMIKPIAQYTKRNIVTVSLGKIKTNQELLDTMFDLKFQVESLDLPVKMSFKDVVFVMEDIDCATSIVKTRSKRSSKDDENTISSLLDPLRFSKEELEFFGPKKKDGCTGGSSSSSGNDQLNLSGLFNVDGVIDCPGRIVIMTTNHSEKLDPALVRPGRVNKKILLSYMSPFQVQKMIGYFYYFCPSIFLKEAKVTS
jgi:chaperone BCS1